MTNPPNEEKKQEEISFETPVSFALLCATFLAFILRKKLVQKDIQLEITQTPHGKERMGNS